MNLERNLINFGEVAQGSLKEFRVSVVGSELAYITPSCQCSDVRYDKNSRAIVGSINFNNEVGTDKNAFLTIGFTDGTEENLFLHAQIR